MFNVHIALRQEHEPDPLSPIVLVPFPVPVPCSVNKPLLRDQNRGPEKNGLYGIIQNVSHYTGTGTPLFPIVLMPVPVLGPVPEYANVNRP